MTHVLKTINAPRRSIKSAFFDKAESAASWLRSAMTNSNLLIVTGFCAIGLFVALLVAFLGEPS